jgi:transposase
MIPIASGMRVWLATGHTDMRRGMNSLSLQVQEVLQRDPHGGDLFVFRGKRGQPATFRIQFTMCDHRVSLAPAVRPNASGLAVSTRQGFEVHLHRRTT